MPMHSKMPSSMKSCPGPSCPGCSSPDCYAEGGAVDSWTKREDHEKGVNKPSLRSPGTSQAGAALHPAYSVSTDMDKDAAKKKHRETLSELQSMPKPNLYAEGGEVDEDQSEIHGMLGEELLHAIHSKDSKAILSCIEACVMQCMNKESV